jgi:hypothetical protein
MAYACICVVGSCDEREDMNQKILHIYSSEGLQIQSKQALPCNSTTNLTNASKNNIFK